MYPINVPEKFDDVKVLDNLFTHDELSRIIEQASNVELTGADVGGTGNLTTEEYEKQQYDPANPRRSNVRWLHATDDNFKWLYKKLETGINYVNLTNYNKMLYAIENLQYSEYDSVYRGFYAQHIDVFSQTQPLHRALSFSLQLSRPEDYEGGDVNIFSADGRSNFTADKQYGSMTFFSSSLVHEVTPVTSGFRKSLVGWVIGPRV
jgi:PKHD-type hydroxylase